MSDTTSATPHVQPLTNRKKFIRGVIGIIVIVVFLIVLWIVQTVKDVDLPAEVNTIGEIAAIKETPNGSQAVLIKTDGSIVVSPGYHDGVHDRDPVWRPDGNRLFFTSDRDPGQVNLYRWNPGSNKVERRTATQGSYTSLLYSAADVKGKGLVARGGNIVEFDPVSGDTTPILPTPPKQADTNSQTSQEGEGRKGSIENSFFANYGTSFKDAAWFGSEKFIVTIMKGDEGETLLLQDMTPMQDALRPPVPIASADHIDMAVDRNNGVIVFTLQGFRFPDPNHVPPEFVKNGKVVPPFRHEIGLLDPKSLQMIQQQDPNQPPVSIVQPQVIVQTPTDANVFGAPVLSPDGSKVLVGLGVYKNNEMDMKGLVVMPAVAGGGGSPAFIHKGPVTSMSFSGDGNKIVYSQKEADGSESIHVMNSDGSGDQQIAAGKGSFTQPVFSPQR